MITASELILHLPKVTGLPESTVRSVYRRLNEAGILPVSRGQKIEKLNTHHDVMLLLALLADMPVKDSAATALSYYQLENENGEKIGDTLVNILNSFRSVNDAAGLAYKCRIEVDCSAPRVCIIYETTEGSLEVLYGLRDKQWSDVRLRRSTTISGKVLYDIAMGVHFNRWPHDAAA